MTDGDRGVPLKEHERDRLADNVASSYYHRLLAGDFHPRRFQELYDPEGGAWVEDCLADEKLPDVVRVETVYIL